MSIGNELKLFISQPMKGKSMEEIKQERLIAFKEARDYIGPNYDVILINNLQEENPNYRPIDYIINDIAYLSKADVIYFAKGSKLAHGCKIEYECAISYGIKIVNPVMDNEIPKYEFAISKDNFFIPEIPELDLKKTKVIKEIKCRCSIRDIDICMIVASNMEGAIGLNGELLFDIPEDMARFKNLTNNGIVIMGRSTYQSIGRPLSNRYNIIISKELREIEGAVVESDPISAIRTAVNVAHETNQKTIWVIGGSSIYKAYLEMDMIDKIELTLVDYKTNADSFIDLDYIFKEFYLSKSSSFASNKAHHNLSGNMINCRIYFNTYYRKLN